METNRRGAEETEERDLRELTGEVIGAAEFGNICGHLGKNKCGMTLINFAIGRERD